MERQSKLQGLGVDSPPPFFDPRFETDRKTRTIQPCTVIDTNSIDNECVAFPLTYISGPASTLNAVSRSSTERAIGPATAMSDADSVPGNPGICP